MKSIVIRLNVVQEIGKYSRPTSFRLIQTAELEINLSCKSTNIQDGGQLNISNQNMSRNNTDFKTL